MGKWVELVMSGIRFYANRAIPKAVILETGSARSLPSISYIELDEGIGTFRFNYGIVFDRHTPLNIRQRVDFLQELSRQHSLEMLTEDEGMNPYQFIYLKADDSPTTIIVNPEAYDGRDELLIEQFYSLGWGMIAVQEVLTQKQEEIIAGYFQVYLPFVNLIHIESTLINPDFIKGQELFSDLAPFTHHYLILPVENSPWFSDEEKSEGIAAVMKAFFSQSRMPVCVFAVNSSVIENIPGGSDSERHCIIITDRGSQKVVYKQRRKSW